MTAAHIKKPAPEGTSLIVGGRLPASCPTDSEYEKFCLSAL